MNISLTFISSKLDSPVIKTLERENLIVMKKMSKKCSTDQRFIRKRNTTYKIGTLRLKLKCTYKNRNNFIINVCIIPKTRNKLQARAQFMVKGGGMAWNFYISFFIRGKKPVAHGNHKSCKKIIKMILKGKVTKKTTFENEAHIKSALPALQLTCWEINIWTSWNSW